MKPSISATTDETVDPITVEELTDAIKYNKNKKAPSYEGIHIEFMKYAQSALHYYYFFYYVFDCEWVFIRWQ